MRHSASMSYTTLNALSALKYLYPFTPPRSIPVPFKRTSVVHQMQIAGYQRKSRDILFDSQGTLDHISIF